MKKLILALLLMAGATTFANAQTKPKTVHKKETATVAVHHKTATKTATSTVTAPKAQTESKPAKHVVASATKAHLKSNGTPDRRFKENKMKSGPLKKNGTPDMRYKANKKI